MIKLVNNRMKRVGWLLIQLFLFIILIPKLKAQSNSIIVQWADQNTQVKHVKHYVDRRWLAERLNIELLSFSDHGTAQDALKRIQLSGKAVAAQMNAVVHLRSTPNDPLYSRQTDNFSRAGFTSAWAVTTGGLSTTNKEIVVAVLDDGFDVEHEDLTGALWMNPGELPEDGIDNDDNGFIDDVNGWNFVEGNGKFPPTTHGTQVLGLLGAEGNNGIGISGTNWRSSIMLLRNVTTIAQTIEAYEYVRQQRDLWNRTDGEQGAFVVATNASFGIEGATCTDYPVWATMYEELGKVGILTAAATANRRWDVDIHGDMPTDCPSDYLITVANANTTDGLFRNSAFGRISIDLVAPGEGSYSTLTGSRYGSFGSTSAAAPYVTGAIALLYATDCNSFDDLTRRDPAAAARYVRSVILSGVRPSPLLAFRTATGGVVDVAASQTEILEQCDALEGEVDLKITLSPNPTSDRVVLKTNILALSTDVQVTLRDALGRVVLQPIPDVTSVAPLTLAFDVSTLPVGYYSVNFRVDSKASTGNLIKR